MSNGTGHLLNSVLRGIAIWSISAWQGRHEFASIRASIKLKLFVIGGVQKAGWCVFLHTADIHNRNDTSRA